MMHRRQRNTFADNSIAKEDGEVLRSLDRPHQKKSRRTQRNSFFYVRKTTSCFASFLCLFVFFLYILIIKTMKWPFLVFLPWMFPSDEFDFDLMEAKRMMEPSFFDIPLSKRLPILVVGGSDGSGTRAVVGALHQLGVPVLADDPDTLDLHAASLFQKQGWPKFVTTVLEATHGSLNYTWEDDTSTIHSPLLTLPMNTKKIIKRELSKLKGTISLKYAAEHRRSLIRPNFKGQHHRNERFMSHMPLPPVPQSDLAKEVAFVVKAPVTLLLLPILETFLGPIRFLHVVRDGRDIALSDNQSPVLKFYNATYPDDFKSRRNMWKDELDRVKGIQLWNDWNTNVYFQNSKVATNEKRYLLVRTEDLVGGRTTKYQTLRALAHFVGSPLLDKPEELCCIAAEITTDHGKSAVHSESANNFAQNPDLWNEITVSKNQRKQRGILPRFKHTKNYSVAKKSSKLKSDVELDRWSAELQERENALNKLEEKLLKEEREASEKKSHRILMMHDTEGKIVPTMFLRQLESWQETVHSSIAADESTTLQHSTALKLLKFGHRLIDDYQSNVQALESIVKLVEIERTCELLEKHLKDGHFRKDINTSAGHTNSKEQQHIGVPSRYGKWRAKLSNHEELSRYLHEEGKLGLQVFGYEPWKTWDYRTGNSQANSKGFTCDDDFPKQNICH